jgi:GT2 family glycosyltransferase
LFKIFHVHHSQKSVSWTNYYNINEVQIDATLHGSFLIMSKEYLSSFDKPFDPGTFLYMEEDILKLRCDKKNIAMVYSPEYEVQHLQAVTTNLIVKDYNEKMIFRIKNIRKSLKRYIQIIKE